ncbi:MAG: adenylosuccinate synthase [Clostridia bacterium]|nr:adenylosuccinate synthase [Clostridia bacterium]
MNCVVVGINWGDEGKGRMVDYLTQKFDVVVRFQGGGNAGHTVINDKGKFALHLLPSGILREKVVNVLGCGVALDSENLLSEIESLKKAGISVTPDNLKISDRASLLFPWHRLLDEFEENRLADKKYGSTKQGIAPFYADKYRKKTVMAGELLHEKDILKRVKDILDWDNLFITGIYKKEPYPADGLKEWIDTYCEKIKPFITDTEEFLESAAAEGKNILFEAQLGSLRDIDYGIYPYTTSSTTLAAYAPIGSGAPSLKVDKTVGIVKAYSTCVGEGPFVVEMFGEEGQKLREAGFEYGAKTGRPRRVGALDLVATKYGVKVQSATSIALTKLDVLSYLDEIKVCTAYETGGKKTEKFPFPSELKNAKPIYTTLKGWGCDISAVKSWEDLPEAAKEYVTFIEKYLSCPIEYVSVGAERDSLIKREI